MATLNIKDTNNLRNLLMLLKDESDVAKQSVKVTNIINKFPFLELPEFEAISYELVELVVEVLAYFVKDHNLIGNIDNSKFTLNFVLGHIFFFTKQEGTCQVLCKLINFYRIFIHNVNLGDKNLSKFNLSFEYVPDLLNTLLSSIYAKHEDFQKNVLLTIIEVISICYLPKSDYGTLIPNMQRFIKLCSASFIGSKIVICRKFIELFHANDMLVKAEVMYDSIPYLILEIENCTRSEEISELLYCSRKCFDYFKSGEILDALCKNWILKKNILIALLKDFQVIGAEILFYIINYQFCSLPWEGNDLMTQIYSLNATNQRQNFDLDVTYLLYYLEFIYVNSVKDDNKISKYMIKKLSKSISSNPPVLKSILLLFSIYGAGNNQLLYREVGQKILQLLEYQYKLDLIISNHPAQLIWILGRGSYSLKLRTLKLWTNQDQEKLNIAVKCAKLCKCENLLLNLLIKSDSEILVNPSAGRINASIYDIDTIYHVLNPTSNIPETSELSIKIAGQICTIMPSVGNPNAVKRMCKYSAKLISNFKDEPQVIKPYISKLLVTFFISIGKGSDDALAECVFPLLRMLIRSQNRLNLWPSKTYKVDLSLFIGNSERRNHLALILIQSVLQNKFSPGLLQSIYPARNLHQKLMSIRENSLSRNVCKTLNCLIKYQETLSMSILNVFYIRSECQGKINQLEFIGFLQNWLQIVSKKLFVVVPDAAIRKSLLNIRNSYSLEAKRIVDLLDRIKKDREFL